MHNLSRWIAQLFVTVGSLEYSTKVVKIGTLYLGWSANAVYCGCISFLPPVQLGGCFWNKLQQRSWNTLHFWRSESRETGAKKTDKITIGKTYFPINQVGVLTSLTAKNPGDQKYPGCTSWKWSHEKELLRSHTVDGCEILHQLITMKGNYETMQIQELRGDTPSTNWCRISQPSCSSNLSFFRETIRTLGFPKIIWQGQAGYP